MIKFVLKFEKKSKWNNLAYVSDKMLLDYFFQSLFFIREHETNHLLYLLDSSVAIMPFSEEDIYIVRGGESFQKIGIKDLEQIANELPIGMWDKEKLLKTLCTYIEESTFGKYIVSYSKESLHYEIVANLDTELISFYHYGNEIMAFEFNLLRNMSEEDIYLHVYQTYMQVSLIKQKE